MRSGRDIATGQRQVLPELASPSARSPRGCRADATTDKRTRSDATPKPMTMFDLALPPTSARNMTPIGNALNEQLHIHLAGGASARNYKAEAFSQAGRTRSYSSNESSRQFRGRRLDSRPTTCPEKVKRSFDFETPDSSDAMNFGLTETQRVASSDRRRLEFDTSVDEINTDPRSSQSQELVPRRPNTAPAESLPLGRPNIAPAESLPLERIASIGSGLSYESEGGDIGEGEEDRVNASAPNSSRAQINGMISHEELRKSARGKIALAHHALIPWLQSDSAPTPSSPSRLPTRLEKVGRPGSTKSQHVAWDEPCLSGSQEQKAESIPIYFPDHMDAPQSKYQIMIAGNLSQKTFRDPMLLFRQKRGETLQRMIATNGMETMKALKQKALELGASIDNAKSLFEHEGEGRGSYETDDVEEDLEERARSALQRSKTHTMDFNPEDFESEGESDLSFDKFDSSISTPTHIKVSDCGYNMANGVFTKMLEPDSAGFPVWLKWGTAFCLRWQDDQRQSAISPPPDNRPESRRSRGDTDDFENRTSIATPELEGACWKDWKGWLLCTFDEENITIARMWSQPSEDTQPGIGRSLDIQTIKERDRPAHPGFVPQWETNDESGWNVNGEVFVQALDTPAQVIHVFHGGGGELGGTYKLSDDVQGRTSYKREDNVVTISWDSDEQKWVFKTEEKPKKTTSARRVAKQPTSELKNENSGLELVSKARQKSRSDDIEPTSVFTWETWDDNSQDWSVNEHFSVHPGVAPASQIYLSGCSAQAHHAHGVYELCAHLVSNRPKYEKIASDGTTTIYWDRKELAWTVDFTTAGGETKCLARSSEVKQIPTDAKDWEEADWDEDEEESANLCRADAGHLGWLSSKIKVVIVQEAPKDIFFDIAGNSRVNTARGVYTKTKQETNGRSVYKKATGGSWSISWNRSEDAWTLKEIASNPNAKEKPKSVLATIRCDVPDPSMIPEYGYTWQCWVVSSWEPEAFIKVRAAMVPPRRLYVKGLLDGEGSELHGVYFLRGHRNARASYTKESIMNGSENQISGLERGQIYWGGDKAPRWFVTARPNKEEPAITALLGDDLPWPSIATLFAWDMEGGTKKSQEESAAEESKDSRKGSKENSRKASKEKNALSPTSKNLGALNFGTLSAFEGFGEGMLKSPRSSLGSRRSSFEGRRNSFELEEADDEEDEEQAEEVEPFACVTADISPNGIFISGKNADIDATLWLRTEMFDGRSVWESEKGDVRVRWNSARQIWQVVLKEEGIIGIEDWTEALCISSDTPDPTLAKKGTWQEFSLPSRASSLSSIDFEAQGHLGASFTIQERDDEDEDSDDEDVQIVNDDNEEEEEEEVDDRIWKTRPNVSCVVVGSPPSKLFVTGSATNVDFTGIFSLIPESLEKRRPVYRAEKVGSATPCEIRYDIPLKRWVIERVPKLGKRRISAVGLTDNTKFILAGAVYDSPDPVLVQANWDVRVGDDWIPQDGIRCREVSDPPEQICIFGESAKYVDVTGTYSLISNNSNERPVFKIDKGELVVRYHKESKRWIIGERDQESKFGKYIIKCNVPNPVETLHVAWQSYAEGTNELVEEETMGCYEGTLPPMQVYCMGGHRGLAGVYTMMYRKQYGNHFAYRKGTGTWYLWWSEDHKKWIIGNIPGKSGLDQMNKGRTNNYKEAWCSTDCSNPSFCTTWSYKGRLYTPAGAPDTNRGVVTSEAVAASLGDTPVRCVKVEAPPPVILLKRSDELNTMRGIYFLHNELKNGRCCYVKQCNIRRSESWAIIYQSAYSKWIVDRSGFQGLGKPQAYTVCDCPDPSHVSTTWLARSGDQNYEKSKGMSISLLSPPARRIFVFGATAIDENDPFVVKNLPLNGTYCLQDGKLHNRRALYRKEVNAQYVVRFCALEQRWLVDGRKPEAGAPPVFDDNRGECSTSFDCWDPTGSEVLWSIWFETKKIIKRKTGPILDGYTQKRLDSDALQELKDKQSGQTTVGTASPRRRLSAASSNNQTDKLSSGGNSDDAKSVGQKSHMSKKSAVSHKSFACSHRSFATTIAGKQSVAASSRMSGMSGDLGSQDGDRNGDKTGKNNLPAHDSWVETRAVVVFPVGPEPSRLYLQNLEPPDIEGVYELAGYHCDRPAYRLVDEDGEFKTGTIDDHASPSMSNFSFSANGYALRWHPESCQWIVGEYSRLVSVTYEYLTPAYDLKLYGGQSEAVYVAELQETGAASKAGVCIGSEIVSINGDSYMFKYKDPDRLLESVSKGSTLMFKIAGFSSEAEGETFLKYDAPYPSSIQLPWMRIIDGAGGNDGDVYVPTDKLVECRNLERPPESVRVQGHKGKPRDVNGVYNIGDFLVNGRPQYVNARWAISWEPRRTRWQIHQLGLDGSVFAFAACFAPHPASSRDHGGMWVIPRDSKKRGLQVVPEGASIQLSALTDIFTSSLQVVLTEARDIKTYQLGKKDGRTRFNMEKIEDILARFKVLLREAAVYGIKKSDGLEEAWECQARLSGYLNIEALMRQGEDRGASLASWMEALTEMRARYAQDRASTEACFDDGWTAAHIVAMYGYNDNWTFDALYELKRNDANLQAPNKAGMTPFLLAVSSERYETVRAFLRLVCRSADRLPVRHGELAEDEMEFLDAARSNNVTVLRTLIMSRGHRHVTVRDGDGQGVLHHLVINNNAAGLETILRLEKLDANLQDNNGDTALHLSIKLDRHVCAFVLLKYGAIAAGTRNAAGLTPYMLALDYNFEDCIAECERSMVTWGEIEETVGMRRHETCEADGGDWRGLVRNKVQSLLQLGFGDTLVDALSTTKNDRLQLMNQLFVKSPEPRSATDSPKMLRRKSTITTKSDKTNEQNDEDDEDEGPKACENVACMELRGVLLAKELLIPLLQLTGEAALDLGDHVKYWSFVKYLLQCGIGAFGGISAEKVISDSSDGLQERCRVAYDVTYPEMKLVTDLEDEFVGRAARKLDTRRGSWRPDTLVELENGTDNKPGQNGWPIRHHYFAHGEIPWLSLDGEKQDLLVSLGALVDAGAFSSVEALCKEALPSRVDFERVQSRLLKNLFIPYWHRAYEWWLTTAMKKLAREMRKRFSSEWGTRFRMQDPMNMSAVDAKKYEYSEICKEVFGECDIAGAPQEGRAPTTSSKAHPFAAGGIDSMLKCCIVVSDVETLQETFEDFLRMQLDEDQLEVVAVRNDFWDCSEDAPDYRSLRLTTIATAYNSPTLLVEISLMLKRYDGLWRHNEILEEIQFGSFSEVNTCLRAYFNNPPRCQFVAKIQKLNKVLEHVFEWASDTQLEKRGFLDLPPEAEPIKDKDLSKLLSKSRSKPLEENPEPAPELGSWIEVLSNGVHLKDGKFDRVLNRDENPPLNQTQLLDCLREAYPEVEWESRQCHVELDGVARSLRECEGRMFFSPSGVLTLVKDFILLHIRGPDGETRLIRNTLPSGFPRAVRKTHEAFPKAARRVLLEQVPAILHEHLKVKDFTISEGAWMEPDPQVEKIPILHRTFVMKVVFIQGCSQFTLLRAGLTDTRL